MKSTISEEEFTEQVLALAKLCGWRCAHFRPARTAKGWRTAVSGDGVGFPDTILVRERVVWIELKTDTGKIRPEQQAWIDALVEAGQEVNVYRPRDWKQIEMDLR